MMMMLPSDDQLALAGREKREFVTKLRRHCLIATAIVLAFWVLLLSCGAAPTYVLLLFMIIGVPFGIWIRATRHIQNAAIQRRGDMDLATAVFLDLVNVLLAGGAGVETAILAAASTGDGWAFSEIRLSIAKSQSARQSYWDGLRELGNSLGVDSLVEVANSVQLAGEHGARIRQSLSAKAASLRQKNMARIEYEAEQRTEKMGLPIVLLFLGFILLIGYPAFVGTIGAL